MAPQIKNTFNRPKPNGEPEKTNQKAFNVKISLTTVITVSVLFLICFGWSFVLGVMVGRDYDPETIMPEFSKVLPLNITKGQIQLTPEELKQTNSEIAQLEKLDTKALTENKESQVIQVEELNFASSLKGKPGEGKLAPIPKELEQKNVQILPEIASKDAPIPANNKNTTRTESRIIADRSEKIPKMPRISQIVSNSTQEEQKVYNYIIQVATLKNIDAVDKLRASLEGYDLRTRMEKWQGRNALLYRVLVVFRGTEKKVKELDVIFKKLRLGQTIQKEKTLIAR